MGAAVRIQGATVAACLLHGGHGGYMGHGTLPPLGPASRCRTVEHPQTGHQARKPFVANEPNMEPPGRSEMPEIQQFLAFLNPSLGLRDWPNPRFQPF